MSYLALYCFCGLGLVSLLTRLYTDFVGYFMISRCECCQGRKIVNGLGGMTRECDKCLGVGYISIDKVVGGLVNDAPVVDVKKRGRKPKVVNVEQSMVG